MPETRANDVTAEPEVDNDSVYDTAAKTTQFLRTRTQYEPIFGIICGSGLGGLADSIENQQAFDFKDIPNFAVSTVQGHKGRLIFGNLAGKCVMCMQGRVHAYEGYTQQQITFPVRVMKLMGVKYLFATNAAGGLNPDFNVGDVMIIHNHINLPSLAGNNALVGVNEPRFGPRFPMMTYDKDLRNMAKEVANEFNFNFMREGVLTVQIGPAFESVAECRMLRAMGADAAGMSTAPEAAVAVHCGMRVFAMSLITNVCVMEWDTDEEVNHADVLEIGRARSMDMQNIIKRLLERLE